MKVYQAIASAFQAHLNCEKKLDECTAGGEICETCKNTEHWSAKHSDTIWDIVQKQMPHGSGFDTGTRFDFEKSTPDKLIFYADYHHMDEHGFYDGWSNDVKIVVTPSLQFGYSIKITGIRRKNRKLDSDYWYDTFTYHLNQEVDK